MSYLKQLSQIKLLHHSMINLSTLLLKLLEYLQKEEKVKETAVELTPSGRPKRQSRANIDYSKYIIDTDKETEEDVIAWAETFTSKALKRLGELLWRQANVLDGSNVSELHPPY